MINFSTLAKPMGNVSYSLFQCNFGFIFVSPFITIDNINGRNINYLA